MNAPDSFLDRPRQWAGRRVIFQVHLWSGLLLGLYFLVIGLTGSLIVFRGEIEDALRPQLTRVSPGGALGAVQPMLDEAAVAFPGARFHTVNLPTQPRRSLSIWGHDPKSRSFHVYFDPWTGRMLGSDLAGDNVTEWLYELHANLLSGQTGQQVNGIIALLVGLLLLSGLVVWWPGRGRVVGQGLTLRWRAGWKRRNYDLHKVVGFYTAVLLLITVVTGIWFPFKAPFRWMAEVLTQSSAREDSPVSDPAHRGQPRITVDAALAATGQVLPGVAPNWIRLPQGPEDVYSVRKRLSGEWQLEGMNYIHVDPQSGAVIRADLHAETTLAQRILRTFFPLHVGSFGGLSTRILWVVLGLAPGLLCVTGTLMWWNRVGRRMARPGQAAGQAAATEPQSPRPAVSESATFHRS
ncbi:MAG: PepSY domain-containing protein [Verrucomicrobiae bacterium]|nr:PepSY domain-containing protein [Verrucomicrobiae bacterium]